MSTLFASAFFSFYQVASAPLFLCSLFLRLSLKSPLFLTGLSQSFVKAEREPKWGGVMLLWNKRVLPYTMQSG